MSKYSECVDFTKAISNYGDPSAIINVMVRAAKGENIKLGFIGGSITQGSLSSTPETCYAYLIYKWWCESFPKATFDYINAGIGGTTSHFGVARAESDLLKYDPDFVIVEFSVNDESNEHFKETYEGLVRKILTYKSNPAVMIIHNVCYDNGSNAQLMHSRVARHYDIPAVSMQSTIYDALLKGKIENRMITPDDLHPNDEGHSLVAEVAESYLESMKLAALKMLEAEPEPVTENLPVSLPAPLTENAYETAVRYNNKNCEPVCNGFEKDSDVQNHITDCFKNGWTAKAVGSSIHFELEGTCIGVQFRKTISLPAPIAKAVVDGDEENAVILDANFDETWGDKLELYTLMEHGVPGVHTLDISIVSAHEDDKLPFYLVSVINS